jgi:hypothetical protein
MISNRTPSIIIAFNSSAFNLGMDGGLFQVPCERLAAGALNRSLLAWFPRHYQILKISR